MGRHNRKHRRLAELAATLERELRLLHGALAPAAAKNPETPVSAETRRLAAHLLSGARTVLSRTPDSHAGLNLPLDPTAATVSLALTLAHARLVIWRQEEEAVAAWLAEAEQSQQ